MWSQWDTFAIDRVPVDCGIINPDTIRKHMLRYARKRPCKNLTIEHNADDLKEDVWFEPVKISIEKTCTSEKTKKNAVMTRSWVQMMQ